MLVDHDVQCGVASELHLLKGRVPLVWADWMKVYLHEKKAIARSEELRSVQIQDALDATYEIPVPWRPEIVHTLRLTLADISIGRLACTHSHGATYQNSTFSSAVYGTPDSHFCRHNRILQHRLTILDRDCFYAAGREWMNELAQALPQEMSATARNDEHTRIRQAARLRMCNTLDRVGMLSFDVVWDDVKEQLNQCVVLHDPLHAKTKTLQRMYSVAVCHSCEYHVIHGMRLPVTGSSERASLLIKSQLAQLSNTSNRAIDML